MERKLVITLTDKDGDVSIQVKSKEAFPLFEVVGILEKVQHDIIKQLEKHNEKPK
jgi:hypothetical protein